MLGEPPPKQREELFERYMDIIYQREQKNRPELLRTDQNLIYGIHKYLAYILHQRAELDETAALMDVKEFSEKVRDFLVHTDPLLGKEALEQKVNQIIQEASQRLVLITSPQAEKIGFGLATIREFFAAAHLVDTAKDTKERDSRFCAIAKSTHWRNVALFFSGRVGRTRSGEAPSMIDVCRQIDMGRADIFLKRGAELVMKMIDDRVLREPHNEIGALQFGLTKLDKCTSAGRDKLSKILENLPEQYRDKVVRPWLEERLKSITPEGLSPYASVYEKLFGCLEPLKVAIIRAANSELKEARLWALKEAIKNDIFEDWVVRLLEKLVVSTPIQEISQAVQYHWSKLQSFFVFPLSPKMRNVLVFTLMKGFIRDSQFSRRPIEKQIRELCSVSPFSEPRENFLYLWTVSQLLASLHPLLKGHILYPDARITIRFPLVIIPSFRNLLKEKAVFFEEFIKIFSTETEIFTQAIVTLFDFLMDISNKSKYVSAIKQINKLKQESREIPIYLKVCLFTLRDSHESKFHKWLNIMSQIFKTQKQFENDMETLSTIINQKSKKIRNHPRMLLAWIYTGCDSNLKNKLDKRILRQLESWAEHHGVCCNFFSYCSFSRLFSREIDDYTSKEFLIEAIERQLEHGVTGCCYLPAFWLSYIKFTETDLVIRLKEIISKFLNNWSLQIVSEYKYTKLNDLYGLALSIGFTEEETIAKFYRLFRDYSKYTIPFFISRQSAVSVPLLNKMLMSANSDVSKMGVATLASLLYYYRDDISRSGEKLKLDKRCKEKLWTLIQNENDEWRFLFVKCLSAFDLKWDERRQLIMKSLHEVNTKEMTDAWASVLEKAGYAKKRDGIAFLNLLYQILESNKNFRRPIIVAAMNRLAIIVKELEPTGIKESQLNLPLSQR